MTAAELRPEWVCTGCAMCVYNACHDAIPAPTGWDRTTDRCLSCAKQDEDAEDTEDRARRMVLEGKKTNEIARACKGVTKKWINDVRKELTKAGDLDPATPKKPPKPSKPPPAARLPDPNQVAAEALLREDPALANKEVAERTGTHFRRVAQWRRKAGIPSSEATRRAEATALIAAEPTLRNADVKARMRYPVSSPVIRQVRSELGIAPPALN
jgi:hypothetical protein